MTKIFDSSLLPLDMDSGNSPIDKNDCPPPPDEVGSDVGVGSSCGGASGVQVPPISDADLKRQAKLVVKGNKAYQLDKCNFDKDSIVFLLFSAAEKYALNGKKVDRECAEILAGTVAVQKREEALRKMRNEKKNLDKNNTGAFTYHPGGTVDIDFEKLWIHSAKTGKPFAKYTQYEGEVYDNDMDKCEGCGGPKRLFEVGPMCPEPQNLYKIWRVKMCADKLVCVFFMNFTI